MTEQELRQQVADIINGWVGATKGSATHLEILRIYNSHTPLARGYAVQPYDAYCATTVSAAWIKAGIAAYTGTECGCDPFIRIAQQKGIWVEDDGYIPKIGDAVLYDWEDSGVGDNMGSSDHIGLVTAVGGGSFTVTEGNMSGGRVGKRPMQVNGSYIRGFIAPDYAMIAAKLSPIQDDDEEEIDMDEVKKLIEETVDARIEEALGPMIHNYAEIPWASVRGEIEEMVRMGVIDGGTSAEVNPDDVNMRLQLLRVLVVAKRYALRVVDQLPGEEARDVLIAELERMLQELKS